VLTDARGRTVYLLEEDRGGESRCLQMCAVIWPPFLGSAESPPTAGDSLVRHALIGTRPRAGGGVQVTYGGHPLYYYLGDREPGEALGHHVEDSWGEWAAVTPGGRQIEGDRVGESGRGRRGRGRDDD
jgi:predicted lipoprotein with Yx(FWY)xxD motif